MGDGRQPGYPVAATLAVLMTGVTVNQVLGLSRKERRKVRAMIHLEATRSADAAHSARIDGKLAYLSMLNPKQAEALRARRKRGAH